MEEMEKIVNLVMNNGMAIVITAYFLYRDWKYQQTLTGLLSTLSAAIDRFNAVVDNSMGGVEK